MQKNGGKRPGGGSVREGKRLGERPERNVRLQKKIT